MKAFRYFIVVTLIVYIFLKYGLALGLALAIIVATLSDEGML